MSQSGVIGAALIAAFVLYLAAKSRIGTYLSIVWGPSGATGSGSGSGSSGTSDGIPSIGGVLPQGGNMLGPGGGVNIPGLFPNSA